MPEGAGLQVVAGGRDFAWVFRGRRFSLGFGFANSGDRETYLRVLSSLPARVSNDSYASYIVNDPYLKAIHDLAAALRDLYGGRPDSGFAEFVLAFVQSLPYVADPARATDWPRFPSEFLLNKGGDCEDSCITLVALLSKFGFDAQFLQMKDHLAVGVAGPYHGACYRFAGKQYFYAETATNGAHLPLGSESEHATPARLLPRMGGPLPPPAQVHVLTAGFLSENGAPRLRCSIASALPPAAQLRLAVYGRNTPEVYAPQPAPALLGAVDLPPQEKPRQLAAVEVELNCAKTARGSITLDAAAWHGQTIVGQWVGAASVTVS